MNSMMLMLFALMSLALSSSASLTAAQDGGMFNEYEQRNLKSTLENILGKLISLEKSQDEIKSSQENMKKSIEISQEEIKGVKKSIEDSQEEIKGVKEILGALRDQNEKIVKGFSTLHNFGSDRVTTLEKISAPIALKNYNCSGTGTQHYVYFNQSFAQLFTPHFQCSENSSIHQHEVILTCPGHDVGIVANCPVSKDQKVLDISRITNVNVGDEVVAYGFGHLAKAWKGIVCDKQVQNTVTLQWSGEHWSGGSGVRPGDFIVQGVHVGMSGSPVSNGCVHWDGDR
jgi:hypothetical protein